MQRMRRGQDKVKISASVKRRVSFIWRVSLLILFSILSTSHDRVSGSHSRISEAFLSSKCLESHMRS
jgi:hypothetical protein